VELVKAEHPDNAGLIGAASLFYTTDKHHLKRSVDWFFPSNSYKCERR
jgi:hypothetical protein